MERPRKMGTPDHTRLNLGQEKYYRPFIDGYIMILQSNLKKVKHIGHNYSFMIFTCGQSHYRRNPNWKPFRLLWDYCERTRYDFYVVRGIIFERLGRNLVSEYELLRDDEKRRRIEQKRIFGVDFGEKGERELGVVYLLKELSILSIGIIMVCHFDGLI